MNRRRFLASLATGMAAAPGVAGAAMAGGGKRASFNQAAESPADLTDAEFMAYIEACIKKDYENAFPRAFESMAVKAPSAGSGQ